VVSRDPVTLSPRLKPWIEATKARLRWYWTSRPAASLERHHRQAAARDPTLEWDEGSRSYRRKHRTPPASREASDGRGPDGRGS
jgi:hypothetical protein